MARKSTLNQTQSVRANLLHFLSQNMVLIVFLVLGVGGFFVSQQPLSFVLDELVNRFVRNSFLVLSLIIPVIAGMGLNFGIVIGAMAGQIAVIVAIDRGFTGMGGFMLTLLCSVPFAILFGYLTGKILNQTKGNEMITTMILGFFANGIYQFVYLFLVGGMIPMKNSSILINSELGVKNTLDLTESIKYSLDNVYKVPLDLCVKLTLILITLLFAVQLVLTLMKKKQTNEPLPQKLLIQFVSCAVLTAVFFIYLNVNSRFSMMLAFVDVPMATVGAIVLLCLFNVFLLRTKLGQDFRTVGHNAAIARVSGINVDRTRIIAIILSTIFSAWGQIIYLQNIGTLNTYASHEQVGTFAVAAIVVGGASVVKATNKQALIGVLLFHLLFIVSPMAGKELFNDPQIGEFFRVFLAYGVIGVSLALYAWKTLSAKKAQENLLTDETCN